MKSDGIQLNIVSRRQWLAEVGLIVAAGASAGRLASGAEAKAHGSAAPQGLSALAGGDFSQNAPSRSAALGSRSAESSAPFAETASRSGESSGPCPESANQSAEPASSSEESASRSAESASRPERPFRVALNTSTIMGQKLSLAEQIDVAAKAGYEGIEPWIRDLAAYQESGGKLADLRKRIQDHGLAVVGAIGFAPWIVDDEGARSKGMEQMRREMEWVAQLGGRWIAAPPAGATKSPLPLSAIAERYRKLLELGQQVGVTPQLEVWGASQTLGRLSEAVHVAIETGHPQACLLLDVYQLYKGGSSFEGLRLVAGSAMHTLHLNDYPADPPREALNDSHRVYPGDGVAPLDRILRILYQTGFRGYLSLELFNRDYWKQDALQVARTGLEKIRTVIRNALPPERKPQD